MKAGARLLIAGRVLDAELVDCDGRRCGRVDDVELHGSPPRISALLVGEGLYPRRLPGVVGRLARRVTGPERWGSNAVRIPWGRVESIGPAVRLRSKAVDMGLGEGDEPERWMVRRLPWN